MFNLLNKSLAALLAVLSLNALNSTLTACECCEPTDRSRMYIGGFGGGLFSNSTKISQMGTAFFTEAEGGPLAVYAQGNTKKTSSGFGGAQIGYELSKPLGCSDWTFGPAVELEAIWYSHTKKSHLMNPTDRLDEHDFFDSFKLNTTVCLANAVFSLNNSCFSSFSPYVGAGVGAAHISIKDADSLQVEPLEAGINHFNSRRNDTSWAFAAQAKAGLRYNIGQAFHVFAEYRYLFIDVSNYIFGSTVYSTHAPTSAWNVKVNDMHYNSFTIGFQYDL